MIITRRIVSIITAISVLLCSFSSYAATYDGTLFVSSNDSHSIYSDYADEVLGGILAVNGRNCEDLYVSDLFDYYNENDCITSKKAIFILDNGHVVGQLTIDQINDEMVASYNEGSYLSYVDEYYRAGKPIKLYSYNGQLVMLSDDGDRVLVCDLDTCTKKEIQPVYTMNGSGNWNTIKEYHVAETTGNSRGTRSLSAMINVPFVANEPNPYGTYLCWAACVASIVSYKKSLSTPYTASNVFFACWQTVACSSTNVPDGSVYWTNTAFSLYNVSMNHITGGMQGNTVYSHISNNRPLLAWITRTGGAHDVVIAGVDYNGGSGYYKLMDPNISGSYVTITVNSSMWFSTNIFTYNTSYGWNYTGWANTWY